MNFASDNAYGALPEILAALTSASEGAVPSYGEDEITARVDARLSEIFEHEVAVFPVVTGTAANSLALATLCPSYGAIFCHKESHIAVDECAAPEFFSGGAKLVPLEGANGKLTVETIQESLTHFQRGVHSPLPSVVTITQSTELGTVYRPEEVAALGDFVHRQKMSLHMDGARFANALAHLRCKAADITWRAGVDALSFGATKNGALMAEAVILFDVANAKEFEYRRKKSGHLISKMRFISTQLDAYLENDRWLASAKKSNALAQRLASALADLPGFELAYPVEANGVFAWLPNTVISRLRAYGAKFYEWAPPTNKRTLVRLVCAFATPDSDVTRFLEIAKS